MSNGNHYHISGYINGERFRYVAPPDWGDDFETLRRLAKELGFPQLSSSTFGLMDGKDIDMDNEISYLPCSVEFGNHNRNFSRWEKSRRIESFIKAMSKPILEIDIGNLCTNCGVETSELNGGYPSGAEGLLTLGWQRYNADGSAILCVTVNGLLCPDCQEPERDDMNGEIQTEDF